MSDTTIEPKDFIVKLMKIYFLLNGVKINYYLIFFKVLLKSVSKIFL